MRNVNYATERLDHLGIVAGVCREMGLAAYPDEQAAGCQQQVSIGTATTAKVLNGLGFSNPQLYLVPQFAHVPHLQLDALRLHLVKIGGWVRTWLDGLFLHVAGSHPGEVLWHLLACCSTRPPMNKEG